MTPLASRGGNHWNEAETLLGELTEKLTGAVDSEYIRTRDYTCVIMQV